MSDRLNEEYDVVVVGGGAAGLNGAMMLGRSRRTVVVIDSRTAAQRPGGRGPRPVRARRHAPGRAAREGARRGPGVRRPRRGGRGRGRRRRTGERRTGDRLHRDPGRRPRRVRRGACSSRPAWSTSSPTIDGLRERWGRDVIHCPYCHGYEVRDQAIGVLATSPMATHQALLFSQLSDDVVLLAHTHPPDAEQRELLAGTRRPGRRRRGRAASW